MRFIRFSDYIIIYSSCFLRGHKTIVAHHHHRLVLLFIDSTSIPYMLGANISSGKQRTFFADGLSISLFIFISMITRDCRSKCEMEIVVRKYRYIIRSETFLITNIKTGEKNKYRLDTKNYNFF